jgi:hypothetical protein
MLQLDSKGMKSKEMLFPKKKKNQCGWFQVYGIHCDVVFQRKETNVLRLVPCKGNSTKCFFSK